MTKVDWGKAISNGATVITIAVVPLTFVGLWALLATHPKTQADAWSRSGSGSWSRSRS